MADLAKVDDVSDDQSSSLVPAPANPEPLDPTLDDDTYQDTEAEAEDLFIQDPNDPGQIILQQQNPAPQTTSVSLKTQEANFKEVSWVFEDWQLQKYDCTADVIQEVTAKEMTSIAVQFENFSNARVVGFKMDGTDWAVLGGKPKATSNKWDTRNARAVLKFQTQTWPNKVVTLDVPAPKLSACSGTDPNGSHLISDGNILVSQLLSELLKVLVSDKGSSGLKLKSQGGPGAGTPGTSENGPDVASGQTATDDTNEASPSIEDGFQLVFIGGKVDDTPLKRKK